VEEEGGDAADDDDDDEVPWECKQCTFINAAGMALAFDVCQCPRYA
jgi:hypothetical protein